ncbi:DNA primase family protein [Mycolicibacter virginiensis]|uniref:DNA primase family protein n=1 Tax=Mycolicibacter virginiensis TaxID=1795032 RepID=UPI001F04A6DC|nr:phage/plasmid primase, P4 family [Mycolicibacter virginiensis]ULP49038.1 phage/plasmid primase, P4 family [Mycolicibacter virginiensis]
MSRPLQVVENTVPICPECGELECDCAELIQRGVDPEDTRGFNPVRWSQAIRAERPIRLDPRSGALWSYSGGVWSEDRNVVADTLPLRMGKTYRRNKHLGTVTDRLRAELKHGEQFIYPDRPDDRFVSLPVGLFDFTNGEVVPHDPDLLVTYQLDVDPTFSADTPEFDRFLADVLHPGDIDRVLDILAYLLRPGNPLQRAVMLTGTGRNGKSVLLNLIEAIAGRQSMAAVPLQRLSTRFAAARLYAKAINLVGEIDGGHLDSTGAFKQMTGGDLVEMDVKHAQAYAAHVWAVPVFSANQIPTSSDTSEGYLRRWEIIEFPNTFDGSDTTIEARLFSERAAIAGKLLRRAAATGFTIRRSTPGDAAREAFATRSDPVRAWLADGETLPVGFTPRTRTYDCYKLWIEDGNGKQALTRNKFYERVAAVLGPAKKNREGTYGWDFPSRP